MNLCFSWIEPVRTVTISINARFRPKREISRPTCSSSRLISSAQLITSRQMSCLDLSPRTILFPCFHHHSSMVIQSFNSHALNKMFRSISFNMVFIDKSVD